MTSVEQEFAYFLKRPKLLPGRSLDLNLDGLIESVSGEQTVSCLGIILADTIMPRFHKRHVLSRPVGVLIGTERPGGCV